MLGCVFVCSSVSILYLTLFLGVCDGWRQVCRGWMHYGKFMDTCSNHDLSVGQGEMGAACMAGCMVAHERCECWVDRPITVRLLTLHTCAESPNRTYL
jgi:hypothetical protein